MGPQKAKALLVEVIRSLAAEKKGELDKLKANHADISRDDFVWHYLLQSFSTMGRASGRHGLIGNRGNYDRLRFEVLDSLKEKERDRQILQACRDSGIRMPELKARYISRCFLQVKALGGPKEARAKLLSRKGRDAKIAFLKGFHGIGDKYARNIMMDVYHKDFRDSVALDVRVKAISDSLGLAFSSYEDHEAFYLSVAQQAGINGWELDRILFNFKSDVERRLKTSRHGKCPKRGASARRALHPGSSELTCSICNAKPLSGRLPAPRCSHRQPEDGAMSRQSKTGFNTEAIVGRHLSEMGLIVKKPIPDMGVDFEVCHPDSVGQKALIQVKGRGKRQRNKKYRWFQVRTTSKQREAAVASGLSLSDAWRKKVDLCDFFIFVSERYGECWVFPRDVVYEIVAINRTKYGNRADNMTGRQAEIDLDIEHEGVSLTKRYADYLNNFQVIAKRFTRTRLDSSSR